MDSEHHALLGQYLTRRLQRTPSAGWLVMQTWFFLAGRPLS
jgi:hypothetical protein